MTKTIEDTFAEFFGGSSDPECDECGTTANLTVHFGMNEQTGEYARHLCTACNVKAEANLTAANAKRNADTERDIYIAKTDN